MIIAAVDGTSTIRLERAGDPFLAVDTFCLAVEVDIGHGRFSGYNADLYFLNPQPFVCALDEFIWQRSLSPRLEATYDSSITFTAVGRAVVVQYTLGDTYCGEPTFEHRLTGGFNVAEAALLGYLADFRSLFASD